MYLLRKFYDFMDILPKTNESPTQAVNLAQVGYSYKFTYDVKKSGGGGAELRTFAEKGIWMYWTK